MNAISASLVLALAILSSSVLSFPSERRDDDDDSMLTGDEFLLLCDFKLTNTTTDIQALNFALSFKHFQYYFYKRLDQYQPQDFFNA